MYARRCISWWEVGGDCRLGWEVRGVGGGWGEGGMREGGEVGGGRVGAGRRKTPCMGDLASMIWA